MKPKITIGFNNGVIGAVTPLDTGVFAIVASATSVTDGFQLGKSYQIKSTKDLADLKITNIENHRLHKAILEFYAECGEGQELWIYGMPKTTTVSSWFTPVAGIAPIENLLTDAKGKIRGIFTVYDPTVAPTVTNGMDADVLVAAEKAELLFKNYTAAKYAPFFTVLEGYAFDGDKVTLPNLKTETYNSVGILIGDTESFAGTTSSKGAAVGVLAGRLAAYPVRVNPGKVANGALAAKTFFIKDKAVESYDTESLYDKGYITFTTHQSKAGYFFMDANTACAISDDYHYITNRRTINEAFRFTYIAALEFLLDEVPINPDGTIDAIYAKTVEATVERVISTNMGDDLARSTADDRDLGVQCSVDPAQNIVSTSKLEIAVKVRPYATNRWINVLLGFDVNNQ